ncbi:MAG: GGDEF domain-containing protein [Thiohalomonadaceae bacterium]
MRNSRFWQVARSAFLDCVSSRDHSHDFNHYRSELLILRVRLFAVLFGLASPVWIPVDRWLLPSEILDSMMALRVVAGLALLSLGLLPARPTLWSARVRAALLVLITLLFYLTVELLTGATYTTPSLIGYTALPLLLVAILALLPLTLIESVVLQLLVGTTVIATHMWLGELSDRGVLGLLWVLLLFIGFSLLAQAFQLRLLLLIHRQATRDSLTGLFNRGALLRHAAVVLEDSKNNGAPYAVLMIDLDRFKQINDTYGHLGGDNVLRAVAGVLAHEVMANRVPGRFGGEEFMLLMGNTTLAEAMQQAEQLRSAIAALVVETDAGPLTVTTSIGVAEGQPGESLEQVVRRADQALYTAKEKGRNLVAS